MDGEDRKALGAFIVGVWVIARVPLAAIGGAYLLGICVQAFMAGAGLR